MNSDPYDSAAWRTFGMLDADEASMFDEAMREDPALRKYSLEMDRLSAAIAASSVTPVAPAAGQIERIQNRLNLTPAKRVNFWFAVSGWAAAAALAVILIRGGAGQKSAALSPAASPAPPLESVEKPAKPTSKVVAKRLTQEIEVLRENLEKFQRRDRVLFAAVPGRALPIIMTMHPPGVPAEESPIATLLGDAVRESATGEVLDEDDADTTGVHPTAMPIYDSARDFGTLVVTGLPEAAEGQVYNLWVTTETGARPIYVGSLTESGATGADSFDFSLGSTMVLPTGFILTEDPLDAPASPTEDNIVLLGPPAPSP